MMSTCIATYSQPTSGLQQHGSSLAFSQGYNTAYLVVVTRYKGSYGAFLHDVPGCGATSKELATVRQLIADGLAFHLEGLLEDGSGLPPQNTKAFNGPLDKEESLLSRHWCTFW